MPPVAVVGAGYAGMAAAVELAGRGVPVTVFEALAVPGGRARRVSAQGRELDNGQHILIGAYGELLRLMRTVGVSDHALLRMPLDLRYFDGFRMRAGLLGVAGALLFAGRIPLSERLGALRFMSAMKRAGFELDEDVSVEDLLERFEQGGAIAHYVWRPLCVSALNTSASEASAQAFLVVLRDALFGGRGASDLLLPRIDLSGLFPEPAARFVEAHGGRILYRTPVKDVDELKKEFASVIVAVGPHQLKALLPAPEFHYQPIYTCYLQYPASMRLHFPMMGLADGLVQWVFDRGALNGENGRLACVISAQGDHQQLGHEELAGRCHDELARWIPGLPRPDWSLVIAEKRATVACTPAAKGVRLAFPGVILAGDYTDPEYPPTLEAAVRSGVRAARAALG
ncbi:MAG: FAD-dependent oxidoreductase [Betaproteobacteria bacterium]|nr:FAD-dependent oxidoreductase [Betaproteobacteria bacterium]